MQITCHVSLFNYVFQILAFQLLDNSANKHAEQHRVSHAVAAAHSIYLNIQNCAWFGRQLSVIIMLWAHNIPCARISKSWLRHCRPKLCITLKHRPNGANLRHIGYPRSFDVSSYFNSLHVGLFIVGGIWLRRLLYLPILLSISVFTF